MSNDNPNFYYKVRVNKFGYTPTDNQEISDIRLEHWMPVTKTVPYNAFKLYMLYAGFNDGTYVHPSNQYIHDNLGMSLSGSYEKAFKELVDAGYIHRFGTSQDEVIYDFFLEPLSTSDYYSYLDSYIDV